MNSAREIHRSTRIAFTVLTGEIQNYRSKTNRIKLTYAWITSLQ